MASRSWPQGGTQSGQTAQTAQTGQTDKASEQRKANEQRNNIINLFKAYKDSDAAKSKPKNTQANRQSVKAMREAEKAQSKLKPQPQ
jgi:hypothetical protein